MQNTELANEVLKNLVELFKTGKIEQIIADIPMIKDPNDNRPCWKWSLRNRALMVAQGTLDGRTPKEWEKVGRNIFDWKKTVRILKPNMGYECLVCDNNGFFNFDKSKNAFVCNKCATIIRGMPMAIKEGQAKSFVKGYGIQPEFAVENTYGKKLEEYTPEKKPELFELGLSLGLKISYLVDPSNGSYGSYNSQTNEIHLGTEDKKVFFHELAHAVDTLILGNKKEKSGQDPIREIVAEFTACILSKMYNHNTEYRSYQYIEHYAEEMKITVDQAINRVLNRVEKILNYIFEESAKINKKGFIEVTA